MVVLVTIAYVNCKKYSLQVLNPRATTHFAIKIHYHSQIFSLSLQMSTIEWLKV